MLGSAAFGWSGAATRAVTRGAALVPVRPARPRDPPRAVTRVSRALALDRPWCPAPGRCASCAVGSGSFSCLAAPAGLDAACVHGMFTTGYFRQAYAAWPKLEGKMEPPSRPMRDGGRRSTPGYSPGGH
jgi:hypothetical protein